MQVYMSLLYDISIKLSPPFHAKRVGKHDKIFRPLSMLMIIFDLSKWEKRRWITILLTTISICVFFIAASPGYSDIYYADVTLSTINGPIIRRKRSCH